MLAFVADEEAGGTKGAHFLVDNHPELFADCTEAISEVGGFSVTLADQHRLYLIQTAEKGIGWLRIKASRRPGHGSMIHSDNAVTAIAEAVTRFGRYEPPVVLTDTMRSLLDTVAELTGVGYDEDKPDQALEQFGGMARMLGAALRNTANPTMIDAGYKANVIPSGAEAVIDTRFLPGHDAQWAQTVKDLVGEDLTFEWIHQDAAVETGFDGALVDAMAASLKAEDPTGVPVPYLMSGGTDAKSFSQLGIRCFGFSPLLLPPDLDFTALFHGIDERVPVDALAFGCRVLARFLAAS